MSQALKLHPTVAAPDRPALTVVPPAPPPAARKKLSAGELIGFVAMVFGMFMSILDIQIVSSSIPQLQAGLAASADEVSWVQTAYLVAEVVMIPLSGWLARLMSTRILFVSSCIGFTLMSLGCALSTGIDTMILTRALQGFIGGAMIPTVFATVFRLFPPSQRNGATIVVGLVATLAPTLGPTIGGYLTETLSWHWLFLINIVPGIAVATLVALFMKLDRPDWSLARSFDGAGLLFMAGFLGCLEYVLEEGPRWQWFEDSTILTAAIVSAVSFVLFLARALTARAPVVSLAGFADRNFALCSLFSFVLGIGLYGSVYLLPLFLARVRGFNSLQIGLLMVVTGVFQFISGPIAAVVAKAIGERLVLALGFALFSLGLAANAELTAQWGDAEFFVPQMLRGLGLMFCMLPLTKLALGTLPPQMLNNASGLYNLTRNLGGALGLAMIGTVLNDRQVLHEQRLAEHMTLTHPQVAGLVDRMAARMGDALPGDGTRAGIAQLVRVLEREATVMTFADALTLMSLTFLAALPLMVFLRKPQELPPEAAGH